MKNKNPEIEKVVSRIADRLMTDCYGIPVERLVLMSADNKGHGGWCRGAVEDILREEISKLKQV